MFKMKCEKVKDRLQAFIDKETSPEVTKEIRTHLLDCISCQNELRNLQKVDKFILSYQEEDVPKALTEKLLNIPYSDKKISHFSPFKKMSVAASILIAFILGAWVSSQTLQNRNSTDSLLPSDNNLYAYFEGGY